MSSQSVNLFTRFLGRLSPLNGKPYFRQQLTTAFLNQQKGENDHRNDFMIYFYKSYVEEMGFDVTTLDLQSDVLPPAICFWLTSFLSWTNFSRRLGILYLTLTLVMLNKLRWRAHFQFLANQITWSWLLIYMNGNQYRSRSVGFFRSQLIWNYTVCKSRVTYPGSAWEGLINILTEQNRILLRSQFLRPLNNISYSS